MAKIIPNDLIKGITGKVCSHSNQYYSMNRTSGKVYTGKRCNPYTGPATAKQVAQYAKFKSQAKAATDWLNANKPKPGNPADRGTALYVQAQAIKKQLGLSNVRQVIYKYMDPETLVITIPGVANSTPSGGATGGNTSGDNTSGTGSDSGSTSGGGSTPGLNPGEENYVNPLD